MQWRHVRLLGTALLLATLVWTQPARVSGQAGAKNGEWHFWGGDAGATHYSPLDQINKDNVKNLQIVWRWKNQNFGPRPEFNWEATPLMIGGVLYTTAGLSRDVVAIDGVTGETLWMWRYDEGARGDATPRQVNRGVSYWTDGRGDDRIIYITPGYHLIALNAKTGLPVSGFGKDGITDLYLDFDQPVPQNGVITATSPPMIVGDVAVIPTAQISGGSPKTKENTVGFIRGYDVRTGKRRWIFHTIPRPGEFGNETWQNDSWSYTGNTGAWVPMSADEELGYVYLPVELPTGDYYGGHRPGDNLFSSSIVCLDAKTGKRVWHFQLTHHDVWDYDAIGAPNLIDVTVDGRRVKAVAEVTKQAFTYVFDRVTGKPLWPIEERPVPQSDVPGEKTAATQPIPSKPPAFDRQGVTVDDFIDFTPELRAQAIELAKPYKLGAMYAPAVLAGANGFKDILHLPAENGGANWQGAAVDPETGMLYVPSHTSLAPGLALVKDPTVTNMDYVRRTEGLNQSIGPATGPGPRVFGPQGLPMNKPPYGRITAIDLNKGDISWMVANGEAPDWVKNHPALKGVNIGRTGRWEHSGLLVTKTLLFAGQGAGMFAAPVGSGGPIFTAYDKATGAIVSEFRLPANQSGLPMTYMVNGRQYIAVAVGAPNVPAELVVLALPQ